MTPPTPEVDAPATTTAEQDRQTAGERKIAEVAPPTTTRAEDTKAQSQQEINRVWETTQRAIALIAVVAGLGIAVFEIIRQGEMQQAAFSLITGLVTLVISTYFSRTNHHATPSGSGSTRETSRDGK